MVGSLKEAIARCSALCPPQAELVLAFAVSFHWGRGRKEASCHRPENARHRV